MEIISVSLDSETLKELNAVQATLGFKSRSKMLRATMDALLNEYRMMDLLKGVHQVVLVITYRENERNHVSRILHQFEKIIKVTVHQHNGALCLDIINVDADADRIRGLFGVLKRSKCVKSMNFVHLGSG